MFYVGGNYLIKEEKLYEQYPWVEKTGKDPVDGQRLYLVYTGTGRKTVGMGTDVHGWVGVGRLYRKSLMLVFCGCC